MRSASITPAAFRVSGLLSLPFDRVQRACRLRTQTLSLRAFGHDGLMVDADLVEGREVEGLIARFLANPRVAWLHAHYARRGCFACRLDRADA